MRKFILLAALSTLLAGSLSACIIEPLYPEHHRCYRCW